MVVNHGRFWLFRMFFLKGKQKASRSCCQDCKARYSNCLFGFEGEEGNHTWNCDATSPNSCNVAQAHNQRKDQNASIFKRLNRKDRFVMANSLRIGNATNLPRKLKTFVTFYANLVAKIVVNVMSFR